MARVSIYVPDDLKERMDAAGDAINWSEIARPAFQEALARFEHRKEQSLQTAIERLRASKEKHQTGEQDQGKTHGREWVLHRAEYSELVAVSQVDLDAYDDEDDGETLIRALWQALDPEESENLRDWRIALFGEGLVLPEYVRGFVEGAQEAFEEIKDKL